MSQISFLTIFVFPRGVSVSSPNPSLVLEIPNLSREQLSVLLGSLDWEKQGGQALASFTVRERDRLSAAVYLEEVWPPIRWHVAGRGPHSSWLVWLRRVGKGAR